MSNKYITEVYYNKTDNIHVYRVYRIISEGNELKENKMPLLQKYSLPTRVIALPTKFFVVRTFQPNFVCNWYFFRPKYIGKSITKLNLAMKSIQNMIILKVKYCPLLWIQFKQPFIK